MAAGVALEREKRPRPERGAKSPSESAWGWGPTRSEKSRQSYISVRSANKY